MDNSESSSPKTGNDVPNTTAEVSEISQPEVPVQVEFTPNSTDAIPDPIPDPIPEAPAPAPMVPAVRTSDTDVDIIHKPSVEDMPMPKIDLKRPKVTDPDEPEAVADETVTILFETRNRRQQPFDVLDNSDSDVISALNAIDNNMLNYCMHFPGRYWLCYATVSRSKWRSKKTSFKCHSSSPVPIEFAQITSFVTIVFLFCPLRLAFLINNIQ